MKTLRMTMAQALLKFLDNQYVEFDGQQNKFVKGIFTIFGHGNVVGLGQALEEHQGEITMYQGRNEQGMANAAIAFTKQKNRREIIACTSSIGPGALNMVTAAGTATVNRIPLLLLPGDSFACRQPDPVLQQIEHAHSYTMTANDAFKAVSKYWDRIVRPEQLMTAVINAMRVLTDPAETGAVTLCLPQDVEAEAFDYPVEFFAKRVHYMDRLSPSAASIDRALEIIKTKKKPLIVTGGGTIYSEAAEELKEFVEKFNIPFAETQAGKGILPWNHGHNLGGMGVTGTAAANVIARDADLVIGLGTRFTDFTTASKWSFQNPEVEFLTINVNSMDGEKLNAKFILGDAAASLKALTQKLGEIGYRSAYQDEIRAVKETWDQEVDRLFSIELPDGLSQTRALGVIQQLLQEDDIVVGSSGSLPGDLQRVWRPVKPKTYHMEYGFSCMGYEITGALGVKMAEPDKEVYCMVGDGSYLMLHSELVTSIQERRKINVLLFDNNGFGCINNLQQSQGIPSFGTDFRFRSAETGRLTGEVMPIDFAANARSYGAKTYTATTVDELKSALEKSRQDSVSTLIDIKVVPGTMTGGYESWWRVGVPEVAQRVAVLEAHKLMANEIQKVRKF
ncbi:Epi-inositol hydrolase [Desulfosporosinus sp. I2]|uniref:3D-(3,5/4)-trihydroxycyclohexane-1,2-dione acylhydrolase (decyclizing) n=1 Tax=Desulfosporosinus sp. I2 TaxID=1617025 RepID=UPI0005ED5E99|nr:3D-(3,5/4)-trihydroxycyclohexane-1,2-dione acylhydrolase (decyclizing) [Desulfosporosinus sp. I2]KJR46186.1 Epi-inositol hydrolase [Desulfosporosinus sp. I2]